MSRSDQPSNRAVALQYGANDGAPVVVASGMGRLAEKIVDIAVANKVPVYEDDSLATILTQLRLGQEIPEELYRAIVEIYVYFLNFDPQERGLQRPKREPGAGGPAEGLPEQDEQ